MSTHHAIEPMRFHRQFLEKPWGGRRLERVPGFQLPAGSIGETWELVDRELENSVVATGPFRGCTLRELLEDYGPELLGRARRSPQGEFPVLVKFLDAREDLSVQVHPREDQVGALPPGDGPKTECWYILDALPGSVVYLGLKPGVDAQTFARAASGPGVVELLEQRVVRAGDFVFVPGGTVHAIGAGVALAEVQQTSDTTYRLYDWGRVDAQGRPRPVHVEQGLRAIDFDLAPNGPARPKLATTARGARSASLVDVPAFAVELVELDARAELALPVLDRARIVVVLAGAGALRASEAQHLTPGDTWLVPASLGTLTLEAEEPLKLLVVRTQE
ncbi:MAG: class I mannose-6-phosphate isomerase [Planctomycetes bacterium]|nr:class I mannose-6-phosphate isomerase [Planctomycetota bacterium]